ncbi:MAG: hypothetical protein ACOX1W_07520 [Catenisphaera adipataccumulans]
MNQTQNRDALIVRTSVVGILTNLFLAAFKAAIGIFIEFHRGDTGCGQ